MAKCGKLHVWHWAHRQTECDPWSEPESEWHKNWKECVPSEFREVVVGPHRADIRFPSGFVIELQASSISIEEIIERELFYNTMMWIVRGHDFWTNIGGFRWGKYMKEAPSDDYNSFYAGWRYKRKAWFMNNRPVFIDTPAGLYRFKPRDIKRDVFGEYLFSFVKTSFQDILSGKADLSMYP